MSAGLLTALKYSSTEDNGHLAVLRPDDSFSIFQYISVRTLFHFYITTCVHIIQ